MKNNPGPAAIAGAVLILVIIIYAAYHYSFRPKSPPPTPDSMPTYVRDRVTKPGMEGAGTSSRPSGGSTGSDPQRPMYGQGYEQKPLGTGGPQGYVPR